MCVLPRKKNSMLKLLVKFLVTYGFLLDFVLLKFLLITKEIEHYYAALEYYLFSSAKWLVNWLICFFLFCLKLHLAALASLKGDIVELNKRLQQTEKERDLLEKKLAKAQVSNSSSRF